MDRATAKLEELREEFSNTVLLICFVLGMTTMLFTILRDYPDVFNSTFWVRIIILATLILFHFMRKRIHVRVKIGVITLLSILLFGLAVQRLGFFSPMKYFPLVVAILMAFLFEQRTIRFFTIGLMLVYYIASISLVKDPGRYAIPPESLFLNPYHWITDLSLSILCIGTTLYMIQRSRSALGQSIDELKEQNESIEATKVEILRYNTGRQSIIEEKVSDLKQLVADIDRQNQELEQVNQSIVQQNERLDSANRLLKQAKEKMIVSDRMASLGLLTAGVCHEIKNPLNHFQASITILRKKLAGKSTDEGVERLLKIIEEGSGRITEIISSLNQFDHSGSTSTEYVNVIEVVENCRSILSSRFSKGVQYEFEYEHRYVGLPINADKLHQVILNIMQNALDAMPEKGEMKVLVLATSDKLILEIADNGHGIDPEILTSVTDPFFTTKSGAEHTGLGLYHAQKLITECGGKMLIESVPGQGTIVRLVLTGSLTFNTDD